MLCDIYSNGYSCILFSRVFWNKILSMVSLLKYSQFSTYKINWKRIHKHLATCSNDFFGALFLDRHIFKQDKKGWWYPFKCLVTYSPLCMVLPIWILIKVRSSVCNSFDTGYMGIILLNDCRYSDWLQTEFSSRSSERNYGLKELSNLL